MPQFHIAQINIAQLLAPEGDPTVADFFANVSRINELAESSPGFIWRYTGDYPDPMVAFNMSVWESIDALTQFVYRSAHVEIFRRKEEWFTPMTTAHTAMWWIATGQLPSIQDGMKRLTLLNEQGPSEQAFTFTQRFAAPDSTAA